MLIRRATPEDMEQINSLLQQVLLVHHEGRPDLFKGYGKKYTDAELTELLQDDTRPVFSGWDENGNLLGYAFCMIEEYSGHNVQVDRKAIYIDDICVDEKARGNHVGTEIYRYVTDYARSIGCYHVTLNVWNCNPIAMKFYESLGMKPMKVGMEEIL